MEYAFLPTPIKKNLEKLFLETSELVQGQLISKIFAQAMGLLGRLSLLEYARQSWRCQDLNHAIFAAGEPSHPSTWMQIFCEVIQTMHIHKADPFLPLTKIYDKYLFSQAVDKKDRLQRLLWFSKLADNIPFVISDLDIIEYKEHLQEFLQEFLFLQEASDGEENGVSGLTYQEHHFVLEPFYRMASGQIRDREASMQSFCERWLAEEYAQYHRNKRGKLDFSNRQSERREYVLAPWIHISLEETFSDIFSYPVDMKLRQVLIQGPPASGKTALAINLPTLLSEFCDNVCLYSVTANPVCRDGTTFKLWLYRRLQKILASPEKTINLQELRANLRKSTKKIVIIIDGLEAMAEREIRQLQRYIEESAFSSLVYVFCVRLHALELPAISHTISISAQDNPYFWESFNEDYKSSLLQEYVGDDTIAQLTWRTLQSKGDEYCSMPQLAEQLDVYAPRLLKAILRMKPLLEMDPTTDAEIKNGGKGMKFRLFHPVCH